MEDLIVDGKIILNEILEKVVYENVERIQLIRDRIQS
jgi:hypothetical protein